MKRPIAVSVLPLILLLSPLLPAAPRAPLASTLTGKVVAVADGDTITVLVDRTQHKIRLGAVDCPERGQPSGSPRRNRAGVEYPLADLLHDPVAADVRADHGR